MYPGVSLFKEGIVKSLVTTCVETRDQSTLLSRRRGRQATSCQPKQLDTAHTTIIMHALNCVVMNLHCQVSASFLLNRVCAPKF